MESQNVVGERPTQSKCGRQLRRLALAVLLGLGAAMPAQSQSVPVATAGAFDVDQSGTANYTIPIEVPPGIGGMQPSLSLKYSSQGENGLLGVGWSLDGLPTVTRCARSEPQDGVRGFVKYDADDRFCLDGKRLMLSSGTYGGVGATYRTELDSIARVASYGESGVAGPAYFTVETKAGQLLEFGRVVTLADGSNTGARVKAPVGAAIKVWALTRIRDLSGNYLTVKYITDTTTGEFRPDRIDYTGNMVAGTPTFASVQFFYDTEPNTPRVDPIVTYERGVKTEITRRLTSIRVFDGTKQVSDYQLTYETSPATKASRVASIKRCGFVGTTAMCMPPVTMTWSGAAPQPVYWGGEISGLTAPAPADAFFAFGDITGDGLQDAVNYNPMTGDVVVFNNTSTGPGNYGFNRISTNIGTAGNPTETKKKSFQLADMNNDLRADIFLYDPGALVGGSYKGLLHVATARGDGTFDSFITTEFKIAPYAYSWVSFTPGRAPWEFRSLPYFLNLGDFNSDGKIDVSLLIPGNCLLTNSKGETWFAAGLGTGAFLPAESQDFTVCENGLQTVRRTGPFAGGIYGRIYETLINFIDRYEFEDFNGDGIFDRRVFYESAYSAEHIVLGERDFYFEEFGYCEPPQDIILSGGIVSPRTYFYVNSIGNMICNTSYFRNDRHYNLAVHINDDGISDQLTFSQQGPSSLKFYYGKGDGTYAEERSATVGLNTLDNYYWLVPGDLNNDGLPDIAAISRQGDGAVAVAYLMRDGTMSTITTQTDSPVARKIAGDRTTRQLELVDVDGDGLAEIFTFVPSTGIASIWRQQSVAGGQAAETPDRVTAITDGLGNIVQVGYGSLTDNAVYERDTTTETGRLNVEMAIPVVRQVTMSDGIGGLRTKSYRYGGLKAERDARGFLGFRWIEETQDDTKILTRTEYAQAWPYTGMVTRRTVSVPPAPGATPLRLIQQTVNTNACLHTIDGAPCTIGPNKIYFPYVSKSIETKWELDTSTDPTATVTTTSSYDRFGNPTVVQVRASTTIPLANYITQTTNAYLNIDTGTRWIIGRVTSSTVASSVPSVVP